MFNFSLETFLNHVNLESKLKDKKYILKEEAKIGKVLRELAPKLPYFEKKLRGRLETKTLLTYMPDIYANQDSLLNGESFFFREMKSR